MIKAIIIDDEKMARTLLEGMLNEYCEDIEVIDSCKDLPSGVKAIRKLNPDIVFLDIEMPGHSGLELLDFFNEDEVNFSIIFTTAYNQYAVQAFKLSATDYLLKPIEVQELEQAIERFKKLKNKVNYQVLKDNLQVNTNKKIAIHTTGAIKFVDVSNIVYLKADGAYTNIVLGDGQPIFASKSLKNFEEILANQFGFFRCHKSYLVNLSQIAEYVRNDGGYLLLKNGHQISISADKTDGLINLINKANNN